MPHRAIFFFKLSEQLASWASVTSSFGAIWIWAALAPFAWCQLFILLIGSFQNALWKIFRPWVILQTVQGAFFWRSRYSKGNFIINISGICWTWSIWRSHLLLLSPRFWLGQVILDASEMSLKTLGLAASRPHQGLSHIVKKRQECLLHQSSLIRLLRQHTGFNFAYFIIQKLDHQVNLLM
jgi:hypothetical protein